MTRYWWVNHNTTFVHEIDGGYLWSPQREVKARSTAYDNMRRIRPGDRIVSYARQKNSYVGRATDFAIAAPKPDEFGAKGASWSNVGWYVPIAWRQLPTEVRHRDFWSEFEPLLPATFSPIVKKTGRGNQKLYLAEIGEPLFEMIAQRGGLAATAPAEPVPATRSGADLADDLDAEAEAAIRSDSSLDETTRQELVSSRRGQGTFRRAVRRLSDHCPLTGLVHDGLLTASHIKPWRSCDTSDERLDGYNGLLLAPQIDRLFDRGFITFQDDGVVLVCGAIDDDALAALGCPNLRTAKAPAFAARSRPYLDYHRTHVFLGVE